MLLHNLLLGGTPPRGVRSETCCSRRSRGPNSMYSWGMLSQSQLP